MKKTASILGLSLMVACATTTETSPKEVVDTAMAFDRSVMPMGMMDADFTPPAIERSKLSNGMEVLLSENHELPMAGFYLVVMAGSAQDEQGKEGVANMVSSLLPRGTASMDAAALSEAFQYLGVNYGAGAGLDNSYATLITLTKHSDKALNLWGQMLMDPAFDAGEMDRLKSQIRTSLVQKKDRPQAIASEIFRGQVYGDVYHGRNKSGTLESLDAFTQDDVRAFYDTWYRPNNMAIVVAGDLTMESVLPKLEATFGSWEAGELPEKSIELPEPPSEQVVYLHHKEGAPQSQIVVGTMGMARSDERYIPATLMNRALGGSFQSRINLNLREDKGFTYGAYSRFNTSLLPGPFYAGGGFRTDATLESVQEILKEMGDIGGDRPVTEEELAYFQGSMVRSFPSAFESSSDLLGNLANLVVFSLPDDYFTNYVSNIQGAKLEDVNKMSAMVDPSKMIIVIVGDKEQVMAPLEEAGFKVLLVDDMGNPIKM